MQGCGGDVTRAPATPDAATDPGRGPGPTECVQSSGLACCNQTTCPDGCCEDGQCRAGITDDACGTGGRACRACPDGRACQSHGCQECGLPGQFCCPGDRCDPGLVCRNSVCSAFGGGYQQSAAGGTCPACTQPNPLTRACSCPPGFQAQGLRTVSDCGTGGADLPGTLALCGPPALAPTSDYGGAFEKDDAFAACPQAGQCRARNPYTSDCRCPDGFTALRFRSLIESPCGGLQGTMPAVCLGSHGGVHFGGAYQLDDRTTCDASCRTGNPLAEGKCDCPAGFEPQQVARVKADHGCGSTAVNIIGSNIYYCWKK